MTPAARIASAIGILDRILAGTPAEQALTGWARASRFAGSGDRAAVRDHVFDALRCLRSYTALAGAEGLSGRALMIGALQAAGRDLAGVFTGIAHAPDSLSLAESEALARAPGLSALALAQRIDCPDWLMDPLAASLGDDLAPVMAAQRDRAPVFLRVNLRRISRDGAQAALAAEGVVAQPHGLAESALIVLENSNKIKISSSYLEGFVELQDAASQAAVESLPLQDGQKILDFCAGGGGKTLAMAGRVGCLVTAHDAAPERMRDLPARAARAGVKVRTVDLAGLAGKTFDLVLVDAPCSGSGTWRRTPDAKWRLTPARLDELMALQRQILDQAAGYVRAGGHVAYMTCSLLRSENEGQIDGFLARHSGFDLGQIRRFTPLAGCDGFFAALLTRG